VFLVILVFSVVCFLFVCGGSLLLIILVFCLVWVFFVGRGVCVAYHFSFLCCTKHTTQKTKMIGNRDPPQTKTKHTTQKTTMTSNTDTHKQKQNTQHRKLKVCFVFVCWVSVLLVILVFCVVCFVFVCWVLCCLSF
jgi:flagellar basal body-associated protein FliL